MMQWVQIVAMERTPLPQPFLVNFILAAYAIVSVEQCVFAAVLMCVDREEDKFMCVDTTGQAVNNTRRGCGAMCYMLVLI